MSRDEDVRRLFYDIPFTFRTMKPLFKHKMGNYSFLAGPPKQLAEAQERLAFQIFLDFLRRVDGAIILKFITNLKFYH